MSVFAQSDYKEVILGKIEENRAERGYKTLLAQAAGCQPSFLSQILHSHIHPTPDHAVGMAGFWKFTEDEQEYFLELVNLARASTPRLRSMIESRLARIRKKNEDLASRYKKKSEITQSQQAHYYSSWHFSAIHILVTIPEFQTASAIARKLEIPEPFAQNCLERLHEMGLIEPRPKMKWAVRDFDIHLEKGSSLTAMNHSNWRQKAISDAQMRREGGLHYTAVHSVSREDFEKIKVMVLEFLDRSRKIVGPSKEEELVCLAMDWFKV